MIDWIISKIEHYSSMINVWAWQKRWKNREEGTGYKKWRKENAKKT